MAEGVEVLFNSVKTKCISQPVNEPILGLLTKYPKLQATGEEVIWSVGTGFLVVAAA